jgi:opacity protein-like surface antigen
MNPRSLYRIQLLALAGAALLPASAALAQYSNNRAQHWEAWAGARLIQSGTVDFPGGSNIKTEDDLGFDFGFGYNIDDHWLVSGEIGWNTVSYAGNLASSDVPPASPARISGDMDTGSIGASVTYNLLDGPITPYVSGTLAWTWIDTNIAVGPPDIGCWWDPWWGQICTPIVNTIGDDSASYGLGVGVRWDFAPGGFVRFGYDERWLDIQNANGTPDFGSFRLEVGGKY